VLGVEMASTGEVACFAEDRHEAFLQAMMAATFRLPKKNILLSMGDHKEAFLPSARLLAAMGFKLYATPSSATFLAKNAVAVQRVSMPRQDTQYMDYLADASDPDVLWYLRNRKIDLCVTFTKSFSLGGNPSENNPEHRRYYRFRRAAIDHNVPLITNRQVADALVEAMAKTYSFKSRSYQELRAAAVDAEKK